MLRDVLRLSSIIIISRVLLGSDTNIFTSGFSEDTYAWPNNLCFDMSCDNHVVIDEKSAEFNLQQVVRFLQIWKSRCRCILFGLHTELFSLIFSSVLLTEYILPFLDKRFYWDNKWEISALPHQQPLYYYGWWRALSRSSQGFHQHRQNHQVGLPNKANYDFQHIFHFSGFQKYSPTLADGRELNVFYSTPSCYTKAVNDYVTRENFTLNYKTDDFLPLVSTDYSGCWTGFFTSRPTSKRFERVSNNVLQVIYFHKKIL